MKREFQVVCREVVMGADGPIVEKGAPIVSRVVADDDGEARSFFEGYEVLGVKKLGVSLDPHQEVFGLEEAAAFLGVSVDQVSKYQGKGLLPKQREGNPRFTRRMLLSLVEDKLMALPGADEKRRAA